jgi:beta-fructofuranosidase
MATRSALHFRPVDGWFGDPIPFFWEGTYHIFYIRGLVHGVPSHWGHLASTDLVHWQSYPDAITPGARGSVDGDACWTGSIIEKDGLFHAFYTGVGSCGQTICHVTSQDLITWKKDARNPILLPDSHWYEELDWRDPSVIPSPEGEGYWMLIGARLKRSEDINPYNACIALATSPDLETWEIQSPLVSSGVMFMDCPDLFRLGDQWCLLMALRETSLRVADTPRGPWRKALRDSPEASWAMAGKTLFDGQRRILFHFLSRREGQTARGAISWGGRMLLPRELYLDDQGQPAVRCLPEILESFAVDLLEAEGLQRFCPDHQPWIITREGISVCVPHSAAVAAWRDAPPHFLFSGKLTLSSLATIAGIFLRTSKTHSTVVDSGYQILFEPDRRRISMRPLTRWDTEDIVVETAFDFTPGVPISFKLFLDGFVLELFVEDRLAMCANLYGSPTGGLALMAREGEVAWNEIRILARD